MSSIIRKSNVTQQTETSSASFSVPSQRLFGPSHEVRATPLTRRAIGNQIGQAKTRANAEPREHGSRGNTASRPGHNFSRIPIYPYTQIEEQRAFEASSLDKTARRQEHPDEEDEARTDAEPFTVREEGVGEGQAGRLPSRVRTKMERAFEADFSSVTVHENSARAKALGAISFTQGDTVHFAPGYSPYFSQGEEYLGHELSHVLQQRSGRIAATHRELGYDINSDTSLESEADNAGKRAASGQKVGLSLSRSLRRPNAAAQPSSAPLQLLREPIRNSDTVLDVNASADTVLDALIRTASVSRQASTVPWRRIFYPLVESQIRGRTLGAIAHHWRDYSGLDVEWDVSITFYMDNVRPTGRTEQRQIATTTGGSTSPSLGSSETATQSSGATVGGGVKGGTPERSGSVSVTMGDQSTQGQTQGAGGGLTASQSQSSTERVSRFAGNLFADIEVAWTAGYSNWDIINPVKWGAHLAGNQSNRQSHYIGTITFDRPNF